VDGYRIYARLGDGATGVVYLGGSAGPGTDAGLAGVSSAANPSADGPDSGWVALKVFDQALTADVDTRRRLTAGALAASVLPDPHLASVVASDTAAARPWVASTLVRGPSLADTVAQTGPLPSAAAGWTALGLARAVATLHQAGLTHRAITPGNVLLDGRGPMLTDFGINRAALAFGPGSPAEDVLLLGCTIFYAATGQAPPDLVAAPISPGAVTAPPGTPDLADFPAELARVVFACLAPDPERRPTADRLVGWLAEVAGQRPGSWLPGPVAARLRDYQELPPSRPASWPRFRWNR
jgi:eukaryotic-like serine/threonine-protein kinase